MLDSVMYILYTCVQMRTVIRNGEKKYHTMIANIGQGSYKDYYRWSHWGEIWVRTWRVPMKS